ncbi:MAG: hypothetical protein P1U69_14300 [Parvibaculaceae bacterium]|nr:hypothetical protein [Parvibaculaceae bacterium]HBM87644.1 hypothetical protein [Rhodobiaceae bacterium]|tara:strand:+ start:626 stop:886 length:261 start_codon:yes stop_codon:yes gene_type:complete
MFARALIIALSLGFGTQVAMAAEDGMLRDYDRESLNFLFEQAQSSGPLSGMSEDDMLITGSIGSSDKKESPSSPSSDRVPQARPAR